MKQEPDERPYIAADEYGGMLRYIAERLYEAQGEEKKSKTRWDEISRIHFGFFYATLVRYADRTKLKKHGETNCRMLKQLIKENAELKKELEALKGK